MDHPKKFFENRLAIESRLDQFNPIKNILSSFRPYVLLANHVATFGFYTGPKTNVCDLVAGATTKFAERLHPFKGFHENMNRFDVPTRPTNIFTANFETIIVPGEIFRSGRIEEALVHKKSIMEKQEDENLIEYYDRLGVENHRLQDLLLVDATKSTFIQHMFDEIPEEMASQNNLNLFETLEYIEKMVINTTHYLMGDEKISA